MAALDLTNGEGESVTADAVSDHGLSYSVYFTDADGNPLELTTYDYGTVTAELER